MEDFRLIFDLSIVWLSALIAGLICTRLRQPVIAGYMLAGIIIGPHMLKLITEVQQIKVMAEFGVAMLLFTLGVDLSLKQVAGSAKKILAAGAAQIIVTMLAGSFLASQSGLTANLAEGFLFGGICAMSSSVVIARTLMDHGEVESAHGQILLPLSLVQDLSLVFIIPCIPLLQNSGHLQPLSILASAGKTAFLAGLVFFGAAKLLPKLLAHSARSNSKEIFLLTVVVLCIGIAIASQFLGLSIALGAFLAGLIMNQSSYAHQALHDVSPLRDVFSTIFFVSVGMLLDPFFIAHNLPQVVLFVLVLIIGKSAIGAAAAHIAINNLRSSIQVGVGLSQIGEFSFILLTLGQSYHLINNSVYNLFFAGAIVSMMATPWLMQSVGALMKNRFVSSAIPEKKPSVKHLKDHVIICGFGRIGRNLGLVLEAFRIPFVVIELNADIVEDLALRGIPHIYGDAMNHVALSKAHLQRAAVLVLTMPDALSVKAVSAFARERHPEIKIIARLHKSDDISSFRASGANAIVQPEFEASIEITRLVLHGLNRSHNEIFRALNEIRTRRYDIFQPDIDLWKEMEFGDDQLGAWYTISSPNLQGQTIRDLDVRGETGAIITAIISDGKTNAFPEPTIQLKVGDSIFAVGNHDQLLELEKKFSLTPTHPETANNHDTATTG